MSCPPPPREILALVGPRGSGKSELGRRVAAEAGVPFADLDQVVASAGAGLEPRRSGPRRDEPPGSAGGGRVSAGPRGLGGLGPGSGGGAGALLARVGAPRFRWLERRALGALLGAPPGPDRPEEARALTGWRDGPARAALERVEPLVPPAVLATGGGAVLDEGSRALLARTCRVVWLSAPASLLAARLRADPTLRPALGPSGDAAAEVAELALQREPLYRAVATATFRNDSSDPVRAARALLELWRAAGAGP